jgi:uncharacterized protein (DUF427 family)
MAVQMNSLISSAQGKLRVHPVAKWIRATSGGEVIVSSTSALAVWEPGRVVPSYAVPASDVKAQLVPVDIGSDVARPAQTGAAESLILTPRTPFSVHSCPGQVLTVLTSQGPLEGAAFAPDDTDLRGYVVLEWSAFQQWQEEDEIVIGHPHDPFARIDVLPSTRHVSVFADGVSLADSEAPTLLFETRLPTRYYFPREDVARGVLVPSESHSICAYKGVADYWTARLPGRDLPDIAWSYAQPMPDALRVAGMIAFFTERLDLVLDDVQVDRPAGS